MNTNKSETEANSQYTMSDEGADKSLDTNTEFIIQTRSRRSNAGNKLQKLLEQELRDIESTKRQISSYKNGNDDEEDEIGLLFQEDEDDEDFEMMAKDDDDEGEEKEDETQSIRKEPSQASSEQAADDLMFSSSESEDSSNENDEDAEEKEIRRQELLSRKKRNKRLQKGPVVIKKQKPKPKSGEAIPRSHHTHEQLNAETLLLNTRRTSKRSSVMENTMKVYEKLSKAEKKRKIIQERIRKHKEQESQHMLTQEERLRIAKETEKLNILSLDKFKEQEVWKKENRLALQKRQKQKFQPNETILQFLSTAWLMTPAMELEDRKYWQEQLNKRDKKKKKYPRKPKKNLNLGKQDASDDKKRESEESIKNDGDVNSLGENSSSVHNQKRIEETSTNDTVEGESSPDAAVSRVNSDELKPTALPDVTLHAIANKQSTVDEAPNSQPQKNIITNEQKITNVGEPIQNLHNEEIKDEMVSALESRENTFENSSPAAQVVSQRDNSATPTPSNSTGTEDTILISPDTDIKGEPEPCLKTEGIENLSHNVPQETKSNTDVSFLKQVTFTDHPQVAIIDTEESPSKKDTANVDESSAENSLSTQTYEGPEQLTSRNFVTLYDFPNAPPNLKDFNTNLFGGRWSYTNGLSATQRPQDMKTVFHSILPSPPQSSVPSPTVDISLDLSALANFPSFGEYDKKIVHQINTEINKDLEIKIKTQPPTGVFLANGIRKKCLITNKECQYFDPRTGVPYSDVEAYKIIQRIQDPISKEEGRSDIKRDETTNEDSDDQVRFKWFGFKNGGIYLDLSQRPAKGVPEGF